jgi:hypothetical protein
MFTLRVRNEYQQLIELSSMDEYTIMDIDGLSPMDARINEMEDAGFDGTIYNSSKAEARVITVTLAINQPAEANRLNLYTYFKVKRKHRIYFSNGARNVYIDGYLQSMPIGFFDDKQRCQLVFRCPDPYFRDYVDVGLDISNVKKLFEFPFDIRKKIPFSQIDIYGNKVILNHGDVETGMIITIKTRGMTCSNVRVVNITTGEYIGITNSLSANEQLVIDTIDKEKSIKKISASGVETNYIQYLKPDSTWLKLWPGDNIFHLLCNSGSEQFLEGNIIVNTLYEGV